VRLVQRDDVAYAFAWDGRGYTVATLDARTATVASTRHYEVPADSLPWDEPAVVWSAALKGGFLLMNAGRELDGWFLDDATGTAYRVPLHRAPGGTNGGGIRSVLARGNGYYVADEVGTIFFDPAQRAWGGVQTFAHRLASPMLLAFGDDLAVFGGDVDPLHPSATPVAAGYVRQPSGAVPTARIHAPLLPTACPGRPAHFGNSEMILVPFDGGVAVFSDNEASSIYYHLSGRP
jgi:hypothetical protein